MALTPEQQQAAQELLEKILERKEAIECLLEHIDRIYESGILVALSALLENFDEGFNSIAKPDLMAALANIMLLIWMAGNLDHEMLFQAAQTFPEAMRAARQEFEATPERKPSILELLRLIRQPEFYRLLRTMQAFLKALNKPGHKTPLEH